MSSTMVTPPRAPAGTRSSMAIGLVLAAMFGFAVMDGMTKILSQSLPISQILWVRFCVFSCMILVVLAMGPQPLRTLVRSQRPFLQFSRALLLMIESGMFMLAFSMMPLADVHAIAALAPLCVVAMSVPILGEKVGWRRWTAVGTGLIGVLLIVRPGFSKIEPPVLIALAGAVLWAAYQIMVRLCSRVDHADTTSLWTALVGLGATTLVGPFVWIWPDAKGWAFLVAISLLGSFGHMALIRAIGMTQPSLLQPYNYTLFVWAVVVGWLLFGDVPDAWTWSGAAIIIASGIYVWHRERVRARAA